jgi:hypothetical protein
MDERMSVQGENQELAPLIPYGMKWDQHDSVRYAHINNPSLEAKAKELKKEVEEKEEVKEVEVSLVPQKEEESDVHKRGESESAPKSSNGVEVHVLKGWCAKFMEGLAKHCKLNSSSIQGFSSEGDKATIILKRSQRWENVSDWLRKDCKLKIRVMH